MKLDKTHSIIKAACFFLLLTIIFITMPVAAYASAKQKCGFTKNEITISKLSFGTRQLDLKKYLNSTAKKSGKITWKSGNKNILTVNKDGVATVKRKGTVTVAAKLDGRTVKLHIIVKQYAPKIAIVDVRGGFARGFEGWIRRYCKEDARFYAITNGSFHVEDYDGLIIPGGGDVNPARYGEKNRSSYGISNAQDSLQISAIRKFVAAGKPVFGICRGEQILNVALGGSLRQHVNAHRGVNLKVIIKKNTFFNRTGKTFKRKFPHTHHQAVKKLGKGLIATMYTGSVIEGIEHETKPVYGVQFHPELTRGGAYMYRFFYQECFNRKIGTKNSSRNKAVNKKKGK